MLKNFKTAKSRLMSAVIFSALFLCAGCDMAYPEIAIVNKTGKRILIKDISFNGCLWSAALAYDETTSPERCLPGEGRVHFKKLDIEAYCREQVENGALDGLCACNKDAATGDFTEDETFTEEPNWFNYQTISIKKADYGDFRIFGITLDAIEQDFAAPSPYGH